MLKWSAVEVQELGWFQMWLHTRIVADTGNGKAKGNTKVGRSRLATEDRSKSLENTTGVVQNNWRGFAMVSYRIS